MARRYQESLSEVPWYSVPSQIISNLIMEPITRSYEANRGSSTGGVTGRTGADPSAPRPTQVSRPGETSQEGPYGGMLERRRQAALARQNEQSNENMGARWEAQGRASVEQGWGEPDQPQGPVNDPYDEFLRDYMAQISGAYDKQISAIGGLDPLFRGQAGEAQENIGGFFDHAGDVAREGIPVTQEVYGVAEGNVDRVYDNLGERLQGMPGQLTDIATSAAGSMAGPSVAESVAGATAPFMAAGETARADAVANLTQHSSAGQNYLNQLASSTTAEAGLHQSAVEQALGQQLQMVAFRQAELEGAKQRALAGVAADVAGSTAERQANAALAQALGLDIPQGVDPMQFLQGQQMMQGGQGQVDPIKAMRDEVGLEQAMHNLYTSQNPGWESQQVRGGLHPIAQNTYEQVRRAAEGKFDPDVHNTKDIAFLMLQELDDIAGQDRSVISRLGMQATGTSAGDIESQVREAIRRLHQ